MHTASSSQAGEVITDSGTGLEMKYTVKLITLPTCPSNASITTHTNMLKDCSPRSWHIRHHQQLHHNVSYRARQLYKNISMLFLFPAKDGKLSTGVNATFNASCYS